MTSLTLRRAHVHGLHSVVDEHGPANAPAFRQLRCCYSLPRLLGHPRHNVHFRSIRSCSHFARCAVFFLQGHENRVLHKECPYSCNLCSCSVWFTWPGVCLQSLWMEILLIPIACFAVIPIGVSAYQLSSSYLRAGACMRAPPSQASTP